MRVNGRLVALGDRADPEKDSVKVDDRRVRPETGPKTYILLNKPKGFVTTVSDPEGRDTVLDAACRASCAAASSRSAASTCRRRACSC